MTDDLPTDATNLAIIGVLEEAPYSTNRAIAERLSIAETDVAKRIRAMDAAGEMRLSAAVDLFQAGYVGFLFLYIGCSWRDEARIAAELIASPLRTHLLTMTAVDGKLRLYASVRLLGVEHLRQICEDILPSVAGITGYEAQVAHDILHYRRGVLRPEDLGPTRVSPEALATQLKDCIRNPLVDELDRNIIAELQYNGRERSRQIARKYAVTEGTIRYRLKKMDDLGLFKVFPARSTRRMGASAFVRVGLQVAPGEARKLSSHLMTYPGLSTMALCTGPWSMEAAYSAPAFDDVEAMVGEISRLPGVAAHRVVHYGARYFYDPRWSVLGRRSQR